MNNVDNQFDRYILLMTIISHSQTNGPSQIRTGISAFGKSALYPIKLKGHSFESNGPVGDITRNPGSAFHEILAPCHWCGTRGSNPDGDYAPTASKAVASTNSASAASMTRYQLFFFFLHSFNPYIPAPSFVNVSPCLIFLSNEGCRLAFNFLKPPLCLKPLLINRSTISLMCIGLLRSQSRISAAATCEGACSILESPPLIDTVNDSGALLFGNRWIVCEGLTNKSSIEAIADLS